jgi:hypothetical protein
VGFDALQNGRLREAVEAFMVGSHQHSSDEAIWTNLAVSLTTLAGELPTPNVTILMLCEAVAAAKLAMHLGSESADEMLTPLVAELAKAARAAGHGCEATAGGTQQDLLHATLATLERAEREEDAAGAVQQLCTPSTLTLRLDGSKEQARGILSAKTLRLAWGLMRVCGVLAVEGLLDPTVLSEVASAQREYHANVSGHLEALGDPKEWSHPHAGGAHVAVRGSALRLEVQLAADEAPF